MTDNNLRQPPFRNPFPFSLYRVGGAVRDELMHYPYSEVDWVVVGATPQDLLTQGFQPVGKDFPVFLHPESKEEYALARTERKSGKGYTGFICHSSPDVTLEDDLRRRDLTINAMAQAENGEVIDPYGGQSDLNHKLLRHVSDAFSEDPVRILRIARFAARYHHLGFRIAAETQNLLRQMVASGEVQHLVAERVWKECERAHQEKSPAIFWRTLFNCGALKIISPALNTIFLKKSFSVRQLDLIFNNIHSANHRLTSLLLWAHTINLNNKGNQANSLTDLFSRLPLPKALQSQSLTTLQLWQWFLEKNTPNSAKSLLAIFKQCNAFKQENNWKLCLTTCHAFFDACTKHVNESLNFSVEDVEENIKKAERAIRRAQAISAKHFMEKGHQGKALGDALEQARLESIQFALNGES